MISLRRQIYVAMKNPDVYVLRIVYVTDSSVTDRVVSPLKWKSENRFIALCLCKNAARCFIVQQITKSRLIQTHLVSVPHPITEIEI